MPDRHDDSLRPGVTYRFICRVCGEHTLIGHEDDWREITEYGDCEACIERRVEADNAQWEREHPLGSTLGPVEAREDVVRCARCHKPTGRNLNIKLCDACDHELDAVYQQWVEEQALRAVRVS